MATWLLTWNPVNWDWTTLASDVRKVGRDGQLSDRWSCGNARRISEGERFFLLRQGVQPRGLLGSGVTASEPYEDKHFGGRGRAWYVDVTFDSLYESPVIPTEELTRPEGGLDCTAWRTQASGVRIPGTIAAPLEALWEERTGLGGAMPPTTEDIPPEGLPDGAKRRVTINAYERNPVNRQRCLAHHGFECAVCSEILEQVYGDIAHEFVEVHHLRPLSELGRSYRINPVTDLIPVCPNCHAILHRRTPPLGIEEARRLLNSSRRPRRRPGDNAGSA